MISQSGGSRSVLSLIGLRCSLGTGRSRNYQHDFSEVDDHPATRRRMRLDLLCWYGATDASLGRRATPATGSRPRRLPHKRKACRSPTLESGPFHGTLPRRVDPRAFVDAKSMPARRRRLRWQWRRALYSRVVDRVAQLASNLQNGTGRQCCMPARQARTRLVRGRIACSPCGSFAAPP